MAEGAIEASAEMYEVPSGDAVEFAFSRFYSKRPAAAAGGLLLPAGEASAVDEASSETGIAIGPSAEASSGRPSRRLSEHQSDCDSDGIPDAPSPPAYSEVVTGCDNPSQYDGGATWVLSDECAAAGKEIICDEFTSPGVKRRSCGTICGLRGMTCDPAGLRAVWYDTSCSLQKCAMPSYVVQAGCITWTPGYPSAAAFPGLGVKVSKGAIFYHGINLENKPWYNSSYDFTCDMQPVLTQKVLCPCI